MRGRSALPAGTAFLPTGTAFLLAAVVAAGTAACARADTDPPPAPAGLTAQAGSAGSVHVMWEPADERDGVTGYQVLQGGVPVRDLPGERHMTDITGLVPQTRYAFTVRARDAAGNLSPAAVTAEVTTPPARAGDRRPPTAPARAAGRPDGPRTVLLSWSAATDDTGVTAYDVYQGGVRIHTAAATETGTRLTGMRPDTAYAFTVRARDGADNSSPDGPPVEITTPPGDDGEPPTVPGDFTATASPGAVELGWIPPDTGQEVRAYELYVDGRPTTVIQFAPGAVPDGRAAHRLTVAEPPGTVWRLKIRARLPDGTWGSFSAERRVELVR
ncbi:fibronectin type III domain-containing protein [Streptomyces sp. NPDC089799]|uniref:fibronectin type III domain-containing protein n=1 Tax=Streptomyces sp. NPDC089799 TaxID=3155066 RepID=UPI0034229741